VRVSIVQFLLYIVCFNTAVCWVQLSDTVINYLMDIFTIMWSVYLSCCWDVYFVYGGCTL